MKIAIVLGNRMNDDGSMSELMIKRLELTLRYYNEEKPDKIIVSGGAANKKVATEADGMYKWLIENGVPEEVIIKEDKSKTTIQNAKFSLPMALAFNPDEIAVITTKEHFERKYLNAKDIFKRALKRAKAEVIFTAYTNE